MGTLDALILWFSSPSPSSPCSSSSFGTIIGGIDGGIQKEAYFFEKKSIILREQTEWVEIVENNAAVLVGANKDDIVKGYQQMINLDAKFEPVFGDGKAGDFICQTILEELK